MVAHPPVRDRYPGCPGRGTDLPGQVTAIIALTALAGAAIETGSGGSRLPLVFGGYALAAAAGAAFIAIENARKRPMLPLSLFRTPRSAPPPPPGCWSTWSSSA